MPSAVPERMPLAAAPPAAALSVCLRCKPPGWGGDDDHRPGADLAAAVAVELGRSPSTPSLLAIYCLSQCKRACVVAFSGEDRFTYLFGDLDPARDAAAVVEAFALYLACPEGFMERAERPPALRAGILGRVPPLVTASSLVHSVPPA